MHLLPKANPLYEHIPARKIALPDVLEKLAKGAFTGYLRHTVPGFEGYCIFSGGKLGYVVASENQRDISGYNAIEQVFDRVTSDGGEIGVYRMTPDLVMCTHALLLGTHLISNCDVRQTDIKNVLTEIKNRAVNGVVRFATDDRHAMLFFKNGLSIGFYHNGAQIIETSPDESRKIAALPGCRLDVFATKSIEELMQHDLMTMLNLGKLWKAAHDRYATTHTRESSSEASPQGEVSPSDDNLNELLEDLQEVAMAYLSRPGKALINKCLQEAGGIRILLDADKTDLFLKLMAHESAKVDSHARIDEMIDLMRSEIAGRSAG